MSIDQSVGEPRYNRRVRERHRYRHGRPVIATRSYILTLIPLLLWGCSFDRTFFPVDERPDGEIIGVREDVVLEAADGKRIHHILVKPRSDIKATVFVFQGSGSKASNWIRLLTPLLENGYQVFLMEYRGFGSSEGTAGHEVVVSDARRAMVYLMNRSDVRNKKFLLLGQSYGGQLAIYVAANYPEQVDAVIVEGTFTSFKDIAVHSAGWFVRPFVRMIFVNPYDATKLIKEIAKPLLVIHSSEDTVVPSFMGEELYDMAGSQKEFWSIDGKHTDALVDRAEEFVGKVDKILGLNRVQHVNGQ